jgi:hypothetical protein
MAQEQASLAQSIKGVLGKARRLKINDIIALQQ